MRKTINIIAVIVGLLFVSSCSDSFLDTKPSDAVSEQEALGSLDAINANIDGVLRMMKSETINDRHDEFGVKSIDLATDLMGGDVVAGANHWFTSDYSFTYTVFANYTRTYFIWYLNYKIVYNCNKIIAAIDKVVTDQDKYKARLKGEALTLRAYAYYNLVRAYGPNYTVANRAKAGVPIYLDATQEGNPRSTVGQVYDQIIADLKAAELAYSTADAPSDISHPSKAVGFGMYARVALEMQDYATAADKAAKAYTASKGVMSRDAYSKGFDDANEQTWMWGFIENKEQSGIYRGFYAHIDMTNSDGYAGGWYNPKFVWNNLYSQLTVGDIRKELIHDLGKEGNDKLRAAGGTIDYSAFDPEGHYLVNYKFSGVGGKGFAADLVLMRPAEMLLIAAEAKYRLAGDGSAELNTLMNARYNAAKPAASLTQVMLERRIELWGEGFAFFDIKRLALTEDRRLGGNVTTFAADGTPSTTIQTNHKTSLNTRAGMVISGTSKYFTYLLPTKEVDANTKITDADQNEL